jgi:hypothetical protein
MEGTRRIVGLRVSDTRIEDTGDAMTDIEETNFKSLSIEIALGRGIIIKMNRLHACACSVKND